MDLELELAQPFGQGRAGLGQRRVQADLGRLVDRLLAADHEDIGFPVRWL
jgi:hypothetical protein